MQYYTGLFEKIVGGFNNLSNYILEIAVYVFFI